MCGDLDKTSLNRNVLTHVRRKAPRPGGGNKGVVSGGGGWSNLKGRCENAPTMCEAPF